MASPMTQKVIDIIVSKDSGLDDLRAFYKREDDNRRSVEVRRWIMLIVGLALCGVALVVAGHLLWPPNFR